MAVQGEQQHDRWPRGLRDRAAHRTRQHEREHHLEWLREQRQRLLDRTPEPEALLARAEHLHERQRQLGLERRQLRQRAIQEEIAAQPPWLTHALGPQPEDAWLRERWEKTAYEIAGHRIDQHTSDPTVALHEHDRDRALRRAITDTRAALGLDHAHGHDLGHEI
jgi:hypothetical protein